MDLGPAVEGVAWAAAAVTWWDGRPVVVAGTRWERDARALAFDASIGDLLGAASLAGADSGWAVVADEYPRVLVGEHAFGKPARLEVRSISDGAPSQTVILGEESNVWSLARSGTTTYVGTGGEGRVFALDGSGLRDLGRPAPPRTIARCLALGGGRLFAGTGAPAGMSRLEVAGDWAELPLGPAAAESFVYSCAAGGGLVFGGTEPTGWLLAWDALTGSLVDAVQVDARTIDSMVYDPAAGVVYASARPSGRILRYGVATGLVEVVGSPVSDVETRALGLVGRTLVGATGHARVWTIDLETGTVGVKNTGPSTPPGANLGTVAVASSGMTAFIGGHWSLRVLDVATGRVDLVDVPGEPQAILARGPRSALLAIYPGGRLLSWNDGQIVEHPPLGQGQNRPVAAALFAGREVIASRGEYGSASGWLTVPGEPPVPVGAPVSAMAACETRLAVGTTSVVEANEQPALGSQVIVYDEGLREVARVVPTDGVQAIVALRCIPTLGAVAGMTSSGHLFSFPISNPSRVRVVRPFDSAVARLAYDQPSLALGSDGRLYGATGRLLFSADPSTLETQTLRDGEAGHAAAVQGGIVYVRGSRLEYFATGTATSPVP